MDARTRTILKHPGYYGHISQFRANYRRMPTLSELNFTKVLKTVVTCTGCNGLGWKLYEMPGGHLVSQKCGICKGSRTMEIDNRRENVSKADYEAAKAAGRINKAWL